MKKIGVKLKLALVAVKLLLIWTLAAPLLAERLIVEKKLEKADAILILGGSATFRERTAKGAELYKKGAAPKILLTDDGERGGWDKIEQRNPKFVELARQKLIAAGVPAENIETLAPETASTLDEAAILTHKTRAENFENVLLVTSGYHTRRALWLFERTLARENVSVNLGIASPETGIQTPEPFFWWTSARGWKFVAGEYLKSFYYSVFY